MAIQIILYIIKNICLLVKALKLVLLLIVCIFGFGNVCFQMEGPNGRSSRPRSLKEFTPLFKGSYWECLLLITGCCKIKLQTQRGAEVCSQGS